MTTTELLLAALVIIGAGILTALIVMISRSRSSSPITAYDLFFPEVEELIKRVGQAAAHHADVSAVVERVRQLDADPDAVEKLKTYPETVRAAAWLHYINALGADLQHAQSRLSVALQKDYPTYMEREDAQKLVNNIRAKLDAAIKVSGQSGLRRVE